MRKPTDFDYLEDKNGRFYRVIGHRYSPERLRVCLSYVPTLAKSEYTNKGVHYLKLSDELGYMAARANFPDLVYQHPLTQQVFIALPSKMIKELYDPRKKLKQVISAHTHPILNKFVSCLVESGIKECQIGIHGSLLLGLKEKVRDYDLVIYGFDNLSVYRQSLPKYVQAGFNPASAEEIRTLTLSALRNHPIGFERMYLARRSRRDTLLQHGAYIFSIHFSYEELEGVSEEIGKPVSPIRIKGVLLDDSKGFFAPYTYPVQVNKEIYRVIAYSFAYYSAVAIGEKTDVFGILRENKVITIDEPYHFITPVM